MLVHARDIRHFMSCARQQYHQIRNLTFDLHVHLPWLTALLSLRTEGPLNEALSHCAWLIRRSPNIDVRLQAFIWRLLSRSSAVASYKIRHEFCGALRYRVNHAPKQASPTGLDSHAARVGQEDRPVCNLSNLGALQTTLSHTLFSSNSPSMHFLRRWAVREVREVVSADTTSLWRQLSLFAIAHTLNVGRMEGAVATPVKSIGELRTWSLASILLVLQITYRSANGIQLLHDGACAILRTLWAAWIGLDSARRRKRTPRAVEQMLWLGFIRTAVLVGDHDLLSEICTMDSFKSRLISICDTEDILLPPSLRQGVILAITVAAAACGVRTWGALLPLLERARMWQDEPALRKTVADAFIREWAQLGREEGVAFKLYTEATQFQLVSSDVISTLAQACLRDGHTQEAFTCLADPVFRKEPKAGFTTALLGRLRSGAVFGLPEDMAITLGRAMCDVAMEQPHLMHARQWEWNVSILARSNCASLAVDVALVLVEHHPQLCSRRWWTTFMHQLCNQRLFVIALRLMRGMPKSHHAQRAMCLALIKRLARASKMHLAMQAWNLLSPGRVPAQVMLMRKVGFQEHALTHQDARSIIPFLLPLGQPRQIGRAHV